MTDRTRELAFAATFAAAILVVAAAGPALVAARPAFQIPFESVSDGENLADPTAQAWDDVPAVEVPLSSAPSGLPNAPDTTVDRVRVQAAHTDGRMFLRLSWPDETADTNVTGPRSFVDAVAVQVPVDRSTRPPIAMGSTGSPVNVWYWRADSGVQELLAGGPGTTTRFPNATVEAQAVHRDGRWALVYARDLRVAAPNRTDVTLGSRDTDVAFAVWNGSNMERSGRKAVSQWYHLPTGPAPEGAPFQTVLWTVAGIAILVVVLVTAAAVRRHGGGSDGASGGE